MITYNIKMELQSARTMHTDIVLTSGDVKAYQLAFIFYSNGKRIDVTGYTLSIKAKRPDGVVIVDMGEVTSDGMAVYDIRSNIYDVPGKLTMEVGLSVESGSYVTTKELILHVREGYGEGNLTAENTTPILAKLSEQMVCAMQAAGEAEKAAEEAEKIANITVSAVALDSGSEPTVEKVDDGEEISLVFGIPKGADGYTPQKGVDYFTPEDIENLNIPDQKEFANALKGSARGEVIRIDDVSPLEHNVSVKVASKNLWDNGSTTSQKGIGTWTITQTGASFARNGSTGATYMFSKKFKITKGTTITFSCSKTGDAALSFYKDKVWGDLLKRTIGNVLSYTATEDTSILPAIIIDSTHNEVVMTDIQVEIGNVATEYEPYVDITSSEVIVRGKNLVAPSDFKEFSNHPEVLIDGDKITIPPTSSGLVYGMTTKEDAPVLKTLKPGKTYSFSVESVSAHGTQNWGWRINYTDGTLSTLDDTTSGLIRIFTIPEGKQIKSVAFYVDFTSMVFDSAVVIEKPQITLSDKKEEYVPYDAGGSTFTPKADGTIDAVKSISPTMTLATDKEGVVIDLEYNKDTNKVIEKLTNAIISLGGNI